MNTDPERNLSDFFPFPKGMKVRKHKIGANPISPLVPAPVAGDNGDCCAARPEFKICWEDRQQGLTVLVRAHENGRLIADVFCTNGELLDKAWVSVALVGTGVDHMSCKAIPLKVPEKNGCSGSADIGPLADAVKELGAYLGVVVLLTV